ncbi:hypothetical protein ABZT34_34495 [Streptomyces sp. NPDC005329]|uniref:hypothetical protein n=1 Tax=Streptomyces sp. NPDC005329 TaxID=3157034 RepID=UPI0033B3D256
MGDHYPGRNYDSYSADQLRAAAREINTDLARAEEMAGDGGLRAGAVESQQDLQRWMRNEATRRDGSS